MEEKKWRVL